MRFFNEWPLVRRSVIEHEREVVGQHIKELKLRHAAELEIVRMGGYLPMVTVHSNGDVTKHW